jgi:DNA primase
LPQARPLADVVWSREAGSGVFETPESRAELEAKLRQTTAQIADESLRRHYQQDMRDRMQAFFGRQPGLWQREMGKSGGGSITASGGGGSYGRGIYGGGGRPGDRGAACRRAAPWRFRSG